MTEAEFKTVLFLSGFVKDPVRVYGYKNWWTNGERQVFWLSDTSPDLGIAFSKINQNVFYTAPSFNKANKYFSNPKVKFNENT